MTAPLAAHAPRTPRRRQCTRGRLFLPLHVFFCLFGIRKDMTSLKGTVTHIGVNNYARVQARPPPPLAHPKPQPCSAAYPPIHRVQLRMEFLKCCMGDGSTDDALPSPTVR